MLNGLGEIVRDEWLRTAEIRREITIDEFMVMPNHMHGIVIVNDNVGATRWVAQHATIRQIRATQRVAPTGPASGSIGAIIGQFKSLVTKRINVIRDNRGCPVWQRNYYERIIRDDAELNAVRKYIIENPMKWAEDSENPNNIK